MPVRHTAPLGAPCWVDLQTSDAEQARAFYGELLGWTADDPDPAFGGYFTFRSDGVPVAGGMAADAQAPTADVWSVYLATDDAARVVAAAEAAGGQVVVPPMAVADLGTMGFLVDAGGAGVGFWEPGTFAGFGVVGEPAAPSWFEVLARDHPATIAFYRDVFGWNTDVLSDTDEFRYSALSAPAGEWLAGVMDAAAYLPEGAPPCWSVYFGTADADASVATAERLGGAVVEPARDTPYRRVAEVTDPQGARFKLVQAIESPPA